MREAMGGFTLVELIMVILLLGVMATFSSRFIGLGTELYSQASSREQLMSDARFVMERLNRELHDAVPGSITIESQAGAVSDNDACLRFWPISTASNYLMLNQPIQGSSVAQALRIAVPLSTLDPLASDAQGVKVGDYMVVFPLPQLSASSLIAGCSYGRCVTTVTAVDTPTAGVQAIEYASAETLAGLSPGSRVYFANQQVRYCVEGDSVTRVAGAIGTPLSTTTVKMAEFLSFGGFYRDTSAFNHQGEVGLRLVFSRKGESVTFNHKIEVFNVP